MMIAARVTAPMKQAILRSKRVAMRRQSLSRQNIRSMMVLARRDDGLGAALSQPVAQCIAVIAFVGDQFG
jgi:hypothetical protein